MDKVKAPARLALEWGAVALIAWGVGMVFLPLAPILTGVAILVALYNTES